MLMLGEASSIWGRPGLDETLGLCSWIYKCGTDVLGTILATNTEPLPQISAAGFDKEGSFSEIREWERVSEMVARNYS